MLSLATRIWMQREPSTTSRSEIAGRREGTSFGLRVAGAALLGASLLAVGCGQQTPPEERVTVNDVKQQTGEVLDSAAQLAQERSDFQQATQQELDEIKTELEALKREADSAQGAARQKLQRQVQELEEKWNTADAKLAALRAEGAQAWAAMKEQVLAALTDLKQSYQEVRRDMTQS
jgi:DNA repair exonuclease SbcCD ATPase subunit